MSGQTGSAAAVPTGLSDEADSGAFRLLLAAGGALALVLVVALAVRRQPRD